jgi:hypothetical protein
MSTHILPLDCNGFAAQLSDYLEGELSGGARAQMAAHASACDGCGALLADLNLLRHDAASLPAFAPSRDLWAGIAERIDQTVVVPMDAPRFARPLRRTWMHPRPAVAAAALVVVTAGITHLLTRASLSSSAVATAAPPSPPQVAVTTPAVPTLQPPRTSVAGQPAALPPAITATARGGAPSTSGTRSVPDAPPASAKLASTGAPIHTVELVYDREIVKLRTIVKERRSQLDPATIAVLEQSITVIDSAIAQSRAALAKDPASGFLVTQLNHSLEKKVELLRTAALLPSRT